MREARIRAGALNLIRSAGANWLVGRNSDVYKVIPTAAIDEFAAGSDPVGDGFIICDARLHGGLLIHPVVVAVNEDHLRKIPLPWEPMDGVWIVADRKLLRPVASTMHLNAGVIALNGAGLQVLRRPSAFQEGRNSEREEILRALLAVFLRSA